MQFKLISFIAIVIVFFASILIFSKPSEEDYFMQVAKDYGDSHQGISLSISDLRSMGSSNYSSKLFYSTYTYQFGSLKVHYWGILGIIFNEGYETLDSSDTSPDSIKI